MHCCTRPSLVPHLTDKQSWLQKRGQKASGPSEQAASTLALRRKDWNDPEFACTALSKRLEALLQHERVPSTPVRACGLAQNSYSVADAISARNTDSKTASVCPLAFLCCVAVRCVCPLSLCSSAVVAAASRAFLSSLICSALHTAYSSDRPRTRCDSANGTESFAQLACAAAHAICNRCTPSAALRSPSSTSQLQALQPLSSQHQQEQPPSQADSSGATSCPCGVCATVQWSCSRIGPS